MSEGVAESTQRHTLLCRNCDRPLLVREAWRGKQIYCPHCGSVMRVPSTGIDVATLRAEPPDLTPKRFFNFPCPLCDCLLEAHTGMSRQHATCPTCGARLEVPVVRPRTGMPDKARPLEGEADTPTPVHAYGASGDQAPQIHELEDGTVLIKCAQCSTLNEIDADTCANCGTPFTMEAAATVGQIQRDRRADLSVTVGVIGLVLFPLFVPALLATWWGLQSAMFVGPARRSHVGYAGLTMGLLALIGGMVFWYVQLLP